MSSPTRSSTRANTASWARRCPPDLVTGDDVDDVASYVAYVAGRTDVSVRLRRPPADDHDRGDAPGRRRGRRRRRQEGVRGQRLRLVPHVRAGRRERKGRPRPRQAQGIRPTANKPLEDFIHESIVDPNAYVEKGFPQGVMPAFNTLPPGTIDALVAFLSSSGK